MSKQNKKCLFIYKLKVNNCLMLPNRKYMKIANSCKLGYTKVIRRMEINP